MTEAFASIYTTVALVDLIIVIENESLSVQCSLYILLFFQLMFQAMYYFLI